MNKEELKARVCEVIRRRNPDIVRLGHAIFAEPELGFKEQKTSAKVRAAFDALGLDYETGWGITGVKARLAGKDTAVRLPFWVSSMPSSAAIIRTVIPRRAQLTAADTMCRSAIFWLSPMQ